MSTGGIISAIIIWLLFLGGLAFCLTRLGKGGGWQD